MNRLRLIPKQKKAEFSISFLGETTTFVSVGEDVHFGQKLLESKRKKIIASYYLPKLLGIRMDKAGDYVGRIGGEYVMEGELIAEKLTTAGMIGKRVVAGVDGVISTDRLHQGYVDILGEEETLHTDSPFEGKVTEISLNKKITIECSSAEVDYLFGINIENATHPMKNEISGEIALIDDGSSVYTERSLKESYEGKIVYAGRYLYPDLAREIYQRGATLIVTYSMDYDSFRDLKIPVVVLGGFGQLSMNKEILLILQDSAGHYMRIDPEKSVALISNMSGIDQQSFKGYVYFSNEIAVGTAVVSIAPDSFGVVGTVKEVLRENNKEEVLVELPNNRKAVYDMSLVEVYTTKV